LNRGRTAICNEPIHLQRVAVGEGLTEIAGQSSQLHAPAILRVYVPESIEQSGVHQIERNLPGGVKIVSSEDEAAHLACAVQCFRVIRIHVVPAILAGIDEGPIAVRSLICDVGIDLLHVGTESEEAAPRVEIAPFQSRRELVWQRFPLADMNHT
jgi:hypothetical protein